MNMNKPTMWTMVRKSLLAVLLLISLFGTGAIPANAQDDFAGSAGSDRGESAKSILQPRNASTGLNQIAPVTVTLQGGSVRITINHITNTRSSGTSGALRVQVWATTTVPVFGNSITAYTLGSFTLNPLAAGFQYNSVDQTVAYTPPPSGCYYLTVALEENQSGTYFYQDLVTLTTGGTPDGSGYSRFSFGGADCSVSTGACVQDSITACLLNGRFRAKVRFRGSFDNFPANSDALRKPVTGFSNPNFETAFFYFNSVDNIEILLKMLDQGNTDSQGHPTIAVLFGSATPLRTEITITDTQTGAFRTYVSPFNTQQGATDFTAFLK